MKLTKNKIPLERRECDCGYPFFYDTEEENICYMCNGKKPDNWGDKT